LQYDKGLYTSMGLKTNQMNCETVHARFVSRPTEVYITPYTSTEQDKEVYEQ